MEKTKEFEYRMYVLSIRHLSGVNKGCQGIHSSQEYANKYHFEKDYQQHVTTDKTLIMLDGGSHPDMIEIERILVENDIHHTVFNEPDLDNLVTSICFLADERVWDKKYFKSYQDYYVYFLEFHGTDLAFSDELPSYEEWLTHIGGVKNEKLIEIIKGKKLSM